ncbi:hypothetical protein V6N11_040474 [Hibiscus sabdariffa]|uniref:ABC1 atypical kinase-like domain-containing protein n=1 Tax=Hibiscus sabdariffa TaxID=183260 RepID=A0ABR2RHK7_9ROSI
MIARSETKEFMEAMVVGAEYVREFQAGESFTITRNTSWENLGKMIKEVSYEWSLVNKQKPIWMRGREEIIKEEYNAFCKSFTNDWEDHLTVKHFSIEKQFEFKVVFLVPKRAPFDPIDTRKKLNNIKMYVRSVFIMDNCEELISDFLSLVKDIIDSKDLPLKISREMLQQNKILKVILRSIVDIIKDYGYVALESYMPQLVDATLLVLREKSTCNQLENKSNIDDEDDKEYDEILMNTVSDLLPAVAKSMSCHFALIFAKLFKPLMKFVTASCPSQDRTMVVACIVEVAQDMGDLIARYVDRLMLLVLKELALSLATNRRNTAFCAGEAIIALKHIFTSTYANFQCQNDGLMKARVMCDMVMNIYSKTVTEDDDKVEKVVGSNRVDDSPCCSVIGEYGGTTNMERIIKAQALRDNNIVGTATTLSSTPKPNSGAGEAIRRDFMVINSVERLSRFIQTLKWLRLNEKFQQFGIFMMSQVGFAREVTHFINIVYNFQRSRDVLFPKHVYPLVHSTVLVETYEQGESVDNLVDDLEGHDRIKVTFVHIETHALLKILLVDNLVHADMRPENTFVCVSCSKAPRKWLFKSKMSKSHVIFFDVGMVVELSNGDQLNLLEIFKVVARRDGRTAECTHKLSQQQNWQNLKAFIEEVEEVFSSWGTLKSNVLHLANCMLQLLEKVRRHRVNIDDNVEPQVRYVKGNHGKGGIKNLKQIQGEEDDSWGQESTAAGVAGLGSDGMILAVSLAENTSMGDVPAP